ncbi:HNH endonuclease [Deinococcus lacus]|uniref:HNH endonuclease n=1 Tax=Deinococcus lacus TaxID=392561 RepID=A0ABW1YAX1_9DEIO
MPLFWPTEQFAYALEQIQLTDNNRRILQAFLDAPTHTLTAHSLAEGAQLAGGWTAANLRIGELARKFAPALGPLPDAGDGDPHWWRYITSGCWENGRFHWTLRPELKDALLSLGWQMGGVTTNEAEGIPAEQARTFTEGATCQMFINAYERNAAARAACITHFGTVCQVCETDLVAVYGEIARGYIQVHHLRSLAEVGGSYKVNPLTDLIPVCPNCHAMLHRRQPAYTPEELRAMLMRDSE